MGEMRVDVRRWYRRRAGTGRGTFLRDDRGATTALLAVLLGGGVLIGATAIVVDVGRVYVEREELQSGADAAALAVANRCAIKPLLCAAEAAATSDEFANRNAKDNASRVTRICGSDQGLQVELDLSVCPAQPANRTACIGTPAVGIPYVEVHTATELANGETLLPPAFAHAVAGDEEYDGTQVGACARAAWGPPTRATGIAIGVSHCNWEYMTSDGAALPSDEHVIYLHDPHTTDPALASCAKGSGGKTAPGGFGYLDANAGTCLGLHTIPTTWAGETGNDTGGCETPLASYRTSRIAVPLPIYDTVNGTGNNTTYHVVGFASFVVTGWFLGNQTATGSYIPPTSLLPRPAVDYCSGSDRCLYGYFTAGRLSTGGTPSAGPNYGLSVVNVVG